MSEKSIIIGYCPETESKKSKAKLGILSANRLPNPEDIIHALDKIIKVFEDRIQVELIKVRWEEIKFLQQRS